MLSFGCLFFTVLSPNGLYLSWLSSTGVATGRISLFASAGQACGFVGTLLAPTLIKANGPLAGARVAQVMQALPLLILAAITCLPLGVLWPPLEQIRLYETSHGTLSLLALPLSRVGLWAFDLAERQVVQQASASATDRLLVFAVEQGLTQVASLGMLVCSLCFPEVNDFPKLIGLSACGLVLAMVILQLR